VGEGGPGSDAEFESLIQNILQAQPDNLAAWLELARAASGRREPPRDEYGDRARCEATMNAIMQGRGLLQQRGTLQQEIKQRSERVRELAKFRSSADTVPTSESLAAAIDGSKVLSDDLWEIFRVLLR